jgi:hypothetical protein
MVQPDKFRTTLITAGRLSMVQVVAQHASNNTAVLVSEPLKQMSLRCIRPGRFVEGPLTSNRIIPSATRSKDSDMFGGERSAPVHSTKSSAS